MSTNIKDVFADYMNLKSKIREDLNDLFTKSKNLDTLVKSQLPLSLESDMAPLRVWVRNEVQLSGGIAKAVSKGAVLDKFVITMLESAPLEKNSAERKITKETSIAEMTKHIGSVYDDLSDLYGDP